VQGDFDNAGIVLRKRGRERKLVGVNGPCVAEREREREREMEMQRERERDREGEGEGEGERA
jgi:hypothetical protein